MNWPNVFVLLFLGEDAYRPEVYGNAITILRGVTSSGASSYKIKDCRGRIVCDKKVREELDRIMENFTIQVDNPIAVSMSFKTVIAENSINNPFEIVCIEALKQYSVHKLAIYLA